MLDPITVSLQMQRLAAMSTCCAASLMAGNLARLLRGETTLLETPFHRRAEELHTHADCAPAGAQWTDHYGRRAHDVDVEHMR